MAAAAALAAAPAALVAPFAGAGAAAEATHRMSAAIHLSTLSEDADDDARSILDSSTLTVKVTVSPRFSFPVGPRDRMSLSEKGMRSASSGATPALKARVPTASRGGPCR